ncbi:DUF485 domain-containing protein [Tepidibacillus infernus]|uniref:DUF485 domain-containing protein n=1 Tax=Tepidibacillus decaturensis TaxID=1413211 RepID=A0A135L793_9BACI|nr:MULTISPECIES: DUF485 domain-containing protein [Tepidibacillus]KXG44777.1 hypothetical protein U473_12645 [Tepidibacillus decaturensis]GBF11542.1 hypothetical protein HK1_01577 [Tepidibacillus sp. HK-1]
MKNQDQIDYTAISKSETFKELMNKKKKFIVPLSIFFFIFYFTLPIMTAYSKVLNTPALGAITWAWVFAFAQFVMTWTLVTIYARKATQFDDNVNRILDKVLKRGGM